MLPTNPHSSRVAKLKAEEEAMMNAATGKDESPTESTKEEVLESSSTETEVITQQEQAAQKQTETVSEDLDYWRDRCLVAEGRYNTSKPKYDSTVTKLRQENLKLKGDKVELLKSLNVAKQAAPKTDILDGVFEKEQVDVLGKETVAKLRDVLKATNDRVTEYEKAAEAKSLKDEEDQLAAYRKADFQTFLKRVADNVPDFAKINTDEEFLAWLKEPDSVTGEIRNDLLQAASASRSVKTCVELFLSYKPKAAETTDSIASRTGTTSTQGTDTVPNRSTNKATQFTIAEVKQFNDEIIRGQWKGRHTEKVAKLDAIDKAMMSGDIIQ